MKYYMQRKGEGRTKLHLCRFFSTIVEYAKKSIRNTDLDTLYRTENKVILECPILIVGGGPVGTTLSALLGQSHVPHILVERQTMNNLLTNSNPRAHFLSNKSMETFRSLNYFDEKIRKHGPPLSDWRYSTFSTVLNTQDYWHNLFVVQDHFRDFSTTDETYIDTNSPSNVAHFSENELTSHLVRHSLELSWLKDITDSVTEIANNTDETCVPAVKCTAPCGHLLTGYEWCGGFSGKLHAHSVVRQCNSNKTIEINSGFIIGTDGMQSLVRQWFLETEGVRFESVFENPITIVQVGFVSRELGRFCKKHNPGILHFVYNSKAIGHLVAFNLEQGIFTAHFPFFPEHQSFEKLFNERRIIKTINAFAGFKLTDLELQSMTHWKGGASLATRFRDITTGRIIIAGDAAHSFPSAGGFGLNSGIADVTNLAWKLSHIYHTHSSRYANSNMLQGSPVAPKTNRYLESYAAERYYTTQYLIQVAKENELISYILPKQLGFSWELLIKLSTSILTIESSFKQSFWLFKKLFRSIGNYVFRFAFCIKLFCIPIQHLLFPYWYSFQNRITKMTQQQECLPSLMLLGADLSYAYRNTPLHPQIKTGIPYIRASTNPTVYNPPTLKGCRIPHCYVLTLDKQHIVYLLSTVDFSSFHSFRYGYCLIVWNIQIAYQILQTIYNRLQLSIDPSVPYNSDLSSDCIDRPIQTDKPMSFDSFTKQFIIIIWNNAESHLINQQDTKDDPQIKEMYCPTLHQIKAIASNQTPFELVNITNQLAIKRYPFKKQSLQPPLEFVNMLKLDNLNDSYGFKNFLKSIQMHYVWSDTQTLNTYQEICQFKNINDGCILLRPDSHIITVNDKESISLFVDECFLLPL